MLEASTKAIGILPTKEAEAMASLIGLYALRRVEADLAWFVAEVRRCCVPHFCTTATLGDGRCFAKGKCHGCLRFESLEGPEFRGACLT